MRKITTRNCVICTKFRRTTSELNPYTCRSCQRTKGREMMLNIGKQDVKDTKGIPLTYFVLGVLVTLLAVWLRSLF